MEYNTDARGHGIEYRYMCSWNIIKKQGFMGYNIDTGNTGGFWNRIQIQVVMEQNEYTGGHGIEYQYR